MEGEPADQYRFDLKIEFEKGSNLDWHFEQRLRAVGYNS
jgi:hypothetical protein